MKKYYDSFIIIIILLVYSNVSAMGSYGNLTPLISDELYRSEAIMSCGDIIIGGLPYNHSGNTKMYGNRYSGSPGQSCETNDNYLNGNDVVYVYNATDDDLLNINLTGLNEYYSGVFIYDQCSDIGSNCLSGATAGPTKNDIDIHRFPIEKGKTYYIVLSSWLTQSFDYTLHINSFACSDLQVPMGEVIQNFVPGETVGDLQVETTYSDTFLTWYSDAALANKITDPNSVNLINNATYYVTQSDNICESAALEVTAKEYKCKDLAIISYEENELICGGSMTLKAKPSGSDSRVYWYDKATGNDIVAIGQNFRTPQLTETTSYWVTEALIQKGAEFKGLAKSYHSSYPNPIAVSSRGLTFYANEPFTLVDVEVFSSGRAGLLTIQLTGSGVSEEKTINIPAGSVGAPVSVTIPLDFKIPKAGTYRLIRSASGTGISMLTDTGEHTDFPYSLGSFGEVRDGIGSPAGSYHFFYNWTIKADDQTLCESPRQEVVASVKQSGDVELDYTKLPYNDSNNTSNFNNKHRGDAGEGCYGANYLNSYEAIYYYKADPLNDDILQIELTNVDNSQAAMFLYSSCGEIGRNCLDGAIVENNKAVLKDVYVNAGEDLIIVISARSGVFDYSLSIEGVDCNNLRSPTTDVPQYYTEGSVLTDLIVYTSKYSQDLSWYRDSALTDKINAPNTEAIVDGKSYYVTQKIFDCESLPLEITPIRFACENMEIELDKTEHIICSPGGKLTLEAKKSDVGNSIFWYSSKYAQEYIWQGDKFETPYIDDNTSYWVEEAYFRGLVPQYGLGKKVNFGNFSSVMPNANGYGLMFNAEKAFNLISVEVYSISTAKNISVQLLQEDGKIIGRQVYPVKRGTRNQPSINVIPLNFQIPGPGKYYLRAVNGPTLITDSGGGDDYPYSLGEFGEITSGYNRTGFVDTYYFFYNWTIGEGEIQCATTRKEIAVSLNHFDTYLPIASPRIRLCDGALLSEAKVLGENLTYYNSRGLAIDSDSKIDADETYYVTQTVNNCESDMLKLNITLRNISDLPIAKVNQLFEAGDKLEDLEVLGKDLTWYEEPWKVKKLPTSTELQDQTTYYVTQTEEDECESDVLGITVHQILEVKDYLFEHFKFHPNPVDNTLFIENNSIIDKVSIYNLAGQKVFSERFLSESIELDVSQLSPGVYLLGAWIDEAEKVFKIVKK